jgi:hypothetical protein
MWAMIRMVSLVALSAGLAACSGGGDDDAATGGSSGTGTGGSSGSGTGGSAGAGTGGSSGSSGTTGGSAGNGTGGAAGAGAGSGGSGGGGMCPTGTIKAAAANNYTFSSHITLKPTRVKTMSELTFDWSGLTRDFLGRTLSPTADIDSVLLVVLSLTPAELEMHINADDSITPFNAGALQLLTTNTLTSSSLYDFGVPGVPENTYRNSPDVQMTVDSYLDPTITDPSMYTIAVMPSTGSAPGQGARMIQALLLDPAASTTALSITGNTKVAPGSNGHTGGTDGTTMSVTYDVDLEALAPTLFPSGQAGVTIDWKGLTTNGLGREWIPRSISQVMVGHYTKTLKELEDDFLDLEGLADKLYRAEVPSDEPFTLTSLMDEQGQAFAGIDGTGTWILALSCTIYCANPAPWYLTVLKPCN